MSQVHNQATAYRSAGVEIADVPEELDLVSADALVEQSSAAIARRPQLLLLDLTRLFFCDARGLGAFVRIANRADAAGCRYGLIAPRPPVAKILRIGGLNQRLPVFAAIEEALTDLTATAEPMRRQSAEAHGDRPSGLMSIPRPARFPAAVHDPDWCMPVQRPA